MRKVRVCLLLLGLALVIPVQAKELPKLTKIMHEVFIKTGYSCNRASDREGEIEYVGRGGTCALVQLDHRLLPKSGAVVFFPDADPDQVEDGLGIIFSVLQLRMGKAQVLEPKNYRSKMRNIRSAIISNLKHLDRTEFRFDDLDVRAKKVPDQKAIVIAFVIPK